MNRVLSIMVIAVFMAAAQTAAAKSLLDTASDAGAFTVLLAAVKAAGLTETLSGKGPYTLFAPSDEAFGKLPKETYQSLFEPQNKQKLRAILLHHVVAGTILVRDLRGRRMETQPLDGDPLLIDATRGIKVDGANVGRADIKADNGVIFVVDTVLMPKNPG